MRGLVPMLVAALALAALCVPALAQDKTQDKTLVYARNVSNKTVILHVDGDYQGEVGPHDWSTLGVDYGEHIFSWANTDGSMASSVRHTVNTRTWDWYVGEPPK